MRMTVAASALLALSSTAVLAQSGRTWDKTYNVSGHASLNISSGEGAIHATSCGSCRTVSIHVDMHDQDLKDYILEESGSGNHVSFSLKRRNDTGWNWSKGRSPEISVQLPRESDVAMKTGSGGLDLAGVTGDLSVSSGSGGVRVQESAGKLEATTGSGGVTAEGGFSQFRMRSGSGTVSLRLRPSMQRSGSSSVSTGSGGVHLFVPRDLRANVHAATGSGGIHSDLPLSTTGDWGNRHEVDGTVNGGGPQLDLHTGSGGVQISGL